MNLLDFLIDWLLPTGRGGWALLGLVVVLTAAAAVLAGAILHIF